MQCKELITLIKLLFRTDTLISLGLVAMTTTIYLTYYVDVGVHYHSISHGNIRYTVFAQSISSHMYMEDH